MRKEVTYKITTEHPTGYMNGEHIVTIVTGKNHQNNRYTKSVKIAGLGCSRDYETPSDTIAISNFLVENGMRMLKMENQ